MALRIQGLVAAARRAQERLRAGIAPAERREFLARVEANLEAVHTICDTHAVGPAALPAPSRRAYEVLTTILERGEAGLPAPRPATEVVRPIRVTHVLANLKQLLRDLDLGLGEVGVPARVRRTAADRVARVRTICEQHDTTPAGLPPPSGRAFGMLAWLAEGTHAEDYAAALVRARATIVPVLDAAGLGAPAFITFEPGRQIHHRRLEHGEPHLKLAVSFLAADEAAMHDLATVIAARRDAPPTVRMRHAAFLESRPAVAIKQAMEDHWRGPRDLSRGTTYDLGMLFERLNRTWFGGAMERPRLEWQPSLSRGRFGYYAAGEDKVVIDARLDDAAVPEFVAECVLFHELLHKHYGTPHDGNRRQVHPPYFLEHERQHPRFRESERWLEELAMSGA